MFQCFKYVGSGDVYWFVGLDIGDGLSISLSTSTGTSGARGLSGKGSVGGGGRSGKGPKYLRQGTIGDEYGCRCMVGLSGTGTGVSGVGGDLPGVNHSEVRLGEYDIGGVV